MVPPGIRLGVAVSGGADSVTLLHILTSLQQDLDCRLTVLHCNHQLRGVESDQDEEFVCDLARSLSLPVVRTNAPIGPGNIEQEARRARHGFYQLWRTQFTGSRVALGQTRSDQCETVLFRLLRGSGLAGLAGMAPLTKSGLVRPLLFSSRLEVRAFARIQGWTWREDASNQDLRFRRNRLRLVTLPQLSSDYNPAVEEVLARTASIAGDEERYWEAKTRKLYARIAKETHMGVTIPVPALQKLHIAEQRRLLRRAVFNLRKNLNSIDSSHINGLVKICHSNNGHDRLMIPGIDAIRSFETLLLAEPAMMRQPRDYVLQLPVSAEVNLPFQIGRIMVRAVDGEVENCVTVEGTGGFPSEQGYLDLSIVESLDPGISVQVRNWQPGDTFQRQGASRPEKIKTLFQENRIVLWERRHWPVLVVGGRIVWVRGFGADAAVGPSAATKNLLQVRFNPAI